MFVRQPPPGNAGHHAVQFYSDGALHCYLVADFLADGIAAGQAVLVIATPEHRRAITTELERRRFTRQQLSSPALVLLDADTTVAQVMDHSDRKLPRLRQLVTDAGMQTPAAAPVPIRVYSEMVDRLCHERKHQVALELERLWQDLARDLRLSMLCGYSAGRLTPEQRTRVCALHTHAYEFIGS
jgi:hypothetical protein